MDLVWLDDEVIAGWCACILNVLETKEAAPVEAASLIKNV